MKHKGSSCILINIAVFIFAFFTVKRVESALPGPLKIEDIIPDEYDNLRTPKVGNGPAQVSVTMVIMNVRNVDVSEMEDLATVRAARTTTNSLLSTIRGHVSSFKDCGVAAMNHHDLQTANSTHGIRYDSDLLPVCIDRTVCRGLEPEKYGMHPNDSVLFPVMNHGFHSQPMSNVYVFGEDQAKAPILSVLRSDTRPHPTGLLYSIRFDLMITKRWMDERLMFPKKAEEEKVVMNVDWRKAIWMPDVFFENSIEGHVQDTIIPNMYLWLFKNKTIQFTARVSIEFSCHMDLRLFPHDTQECDMIVMSLTHTEDEMKLIWDKNCNVTQGDNIVLPQFEIVSVGSDECHKGAHFSCLRGTVTMTRRAGYYITNVYVPTSLIVFMSMLSFWIPPDAVPARVTLGVTSLLTIVTKQYQASLPNVSYIVALNVWLSACIGFVFISLLEYATVIALYTSIKKKTKPVPTVTEQIRVIHKVYPRDTRKVRSGWSVDKPPRREKKGLKKFVARITPENIDYVSRIAFPCVFISQCSIYYAVYGGSF